MREGLLDQETVLRKVMRRQATLSLSIAAVFILLLIGLPLVNLYAPSVAGLRVGGFTLTWLFLAVLFFPITWVLSAVFVKRSNEIEEELTREIGRHDHPHEPPPPLEEVLAEEKDDLSFAPPPSPSPSLQDEERA